MTAFLPVQPRPNPGGADGRRSQTRGAIPVIIRHANESNYVSVIRVINDWWGGRQMADMLPKLFFQHFQPSSFIAEQDGEMIGFLVGFLSQTYPDEAYIHFVGVHPAYRRMGVARRLYERFFSVTARHGRTTVRCITSPVNQASIRFHTRLGFEIEPGDGEVDGIPYTSNYDGRGHDRVLFVKKLPLTEEH
jgi:ribosomal protein S18 acetylase RimI-like enzyme